MDQPISAYLQKQSIHTTKAHKNKGSIEIAVKVSLLSVAYILWILVCVSSTGVATTQSIAAGTITSLLALLHILAESSDKNFNINA